MRKVINNWTKKGQILNKTLPTQNRSIILVHGFVGSPYDMKPLADVLADKGYRVVIPLVPGQTSSSKILARGGYTPQDYVNSLQKIVDNEIKQTGLLPSLVGFSMGGATSTIVATEGKIYKLALIAPFFELTKNHTLYTNIASRIKHYIPVILKLSKGKINYKDGKKQYFPGSYFISLSAYYQLSKLGQLAKLRAADIDIPAIIIGSHNDEVASFKVTKDLFEGHQHVEIIDYPNSNHILLYDYDKEGCIQRLVEFLTQN